IKGNFLGDKLILTADEWPAGSFVSFQQRLRASVELVRRARAAGGQGVTRRHCGDEHLMAFPLADVDRREILTPSPPRCRPGLGEPIEEEVDLSLAPRLERGEFLAARHRPSPKLRGDMMELARIDDLEECGGLQVSSADIERKVAERRVLAIGQVHGRPY